MSRSLEKNGRNAPRSNRYLRWAQKKRELQRLVADQRKSWQEQEVAWLVQQFAGIYVEDIKPKNMMRNPHLSKAIAAQSWGQFRAMLKMKCQQHGRKYSEVSAKHTSMNCSGCGWTNEELTLADREWTCGGCGATHDRDVNAAQNVLKRGLALKLPDVPTKTGAVVVPCKAVRPLEPEITGKAPSSRIRTEKRKRIRVIRRNITKKRQSNAKQ
jgi:IS605 OrfB family transposase